MLQWDQSNDFGAGFIREFNGFPENHFLAGFLLRFHDDFPNEESGDARLALSLKCRDQYIFQCSQNCFRMLSLHTAGRRYLGCKGRHAVGFEPKLLNLVTVHVLRESDAAHRPLLECGHTEAHCG